MEVHPMNFSDFLLAFDYTKAAEICNNRITRVSDSTHEFLLEQLRIYWLVGGMPECLKVYRDTKSLKQAAECKMKFLKLTVWISISINQRPIINFITGQGMQKTAAQKLII